MRWDFDDDGSFDDAVGPTPDFDRVGQDGTATVRLLVTNASGLAHVDETTVTVDNAPPSVSFDPQDPEDEGDSLLLTGTVTDAGWLDDLDGTVDWGDGSGLEPLSGTLDSTRPDAVLTFSASHCYGDDGAYTVEVCGSDDDVTTCETELVTIDNAAPIVQVDGGQVTAIDEGQTVDVLAGFSDPGWLDTYTAAIDWGYAPWPADPASVIVTSQGSGCADPDVGSASGSRRYGDNDDGSGFTVTVSVADDDGGLGADSFGLTVRNVDPTAEIDQSGAVDVCGTPVFIAHAGEDVTLSGRSTDPGSDDLLLSWDWGGGPPSPDVTTSYLVENPVAGPDGLPTPEVDPRDVTDTKTHAFDACLYTVGFFAEDDDGGAAQDTADVAIVGNADVVRSAGYWFKSYRGNGRAFFSNEQLSCYLDIVNHLSAVFSEEVDADSTGDAAEVLDPSHSRGDIRVQLDRQLLAVWLNFANGAVEHDQLVDTDGDGLPDTALLTFLCTAETVRLNPGTTHSELEDLKDLLEAINLLGQVTT